MSRLLNDTIVTAAAATLLVIGIRATRVFDRGINERVATILVAALFLSSPARLTYRAVAAISLLVTSVPFRPPIERVGGYLTILASGLILSALEQKK
jgi:arginine exporter protein ArgO